MILREEPKDKIMHYFNKDLFPMLNKYTIKGLDQDYFDFKTVMEETNIIKSRTYKQAWKNACQIFMDGISLCFDNLFLLNKDNEDNNLYKEYCKKKENFSKDVNILFRFEKVINEYYQTYKINEIHLYEPEINDNIFDTKNLDKEALGSFTFDEKMEEKSDLLSLYSPFSNNYESDFIFENKKFFINNKSYNKEKNNNLKVYNKKNNNKNNKNNELTSISSNNTKKISTKQIVINFPKYKSYKTDHRKKKIKEYKFKKIKRENVDKKILRKFKKFLKNRLKEKSENEVKNYINNNGFWPDYISMNLMPPFSYEKENISFKSFNTDYLCWFFEHKFSLELFNIFIKIKYNDLLDKIKDDCKLKENSDDYNLLKVYINSMPMIYGNEIARSTAFSSKIAESDIEDIKNNKEQMSIEEENSIENKSNNKEDNDMIIENDIKKENNKYINNDINNDINFDYISSNININVNNDNNINSGNNNLINNSDFIYMNGNNTEMNISPSININENGEINNENLNNSFENNNQGIIKFNKNLFNII